MKKFVKAISVVILIVLAATFAIACSEYGAPNYSAANPSYITTDKNLEKDLTDELDAFMANNVDRTTFTDGEKKAAAYLNDRLSELGFTDVAIQDFTATEGDVTGLTSQNVIAHLNPDRTDSVKNVIIGAYYDNRYGTAYNGAASDKAEGALCGGTGVATLLTVANYLINKRYSVPPDLDVTFVFFGASYVSVTGAEQYIRNMSAQEYQNTILMVELQRLGCDNVYAFCDARQTRRESFFDAVAQQNELNIYKSTAKSPQLTGVSGLNGIPYHQWVHAGVFGLFFNENIPTLNLVAANWETLDLSDGESRDGEKLSFTERDTLENLKSVFPDYASKMATAASLVLNSLSDRDFVSVMEYDKNHFPDTDALAKIWIWYLIVFCALLIVGAAQCGICAYIRKKHPVPQPSVRRVKMAVFGMDYEDGKPGDLFVDIMSNDVGEIFPGIPNNAPHTDGIDGIFPVHDGVRSPDIEEARQPKITDPSDSSEHTVETSTGESEQAEPDTFDDPFGFPPIGDGNVAPAEKRKTQKRASRRSKKSETSKEPNDGDNEDRP